MSNIYKCHEEMEMSITELLIDLVIYSFHFALWIIIFLLSLTLPGVFFNKIPLILHERTGGNRGTVVSQWTAGQQDERRG